MLLSDVLAITRSALAGTVTAAVALLLPLFGSAVLLLTVALLLMTVAFGTLELIAATTVIVAEPDTARLPTVQVSGCRGLPGIPAVQEEPAGDTESSCAEGEVKQREKER